MAVDHAQIDKLIERIIASGLAASRDDFVPCSEEEIRQIEKHHGVVLPEEYKKFLRVMGKNDASFLEGDHISALYRDLPGLGTHFSYEFYAHVPPKLKGTFFVFATRMGDANFGLYIDGNDDPEVYRFDDCDSFERVFDSIWGFVEGMVEYYE